MISFLTSRAPLLVLLPVLVGCSFSTSGKLTDHISGIVLLEGFQGELSNWDLTGNRYWSATADRDSITVVNTPLGAGLSPVWYKGLTPGNFEIRVIATLDKEGLDGGWGVEFGAQEKKYAYRALIYGSGRFCVDRLFDLYPEFIHCIPYQPEVRTGQTSNILTLRVEGDKITITINGEEVIAFTDDRYTPGNLALVVAGAGTGVVFEDLVLLSLE